MFAFVLVLGCGIPLLAPGESRASTQGEAIVAAAASMAGRPYCWDGGNESGPTHGAGNQEGASQCGGSTVGFDCTGLTQYAAYQGTGGAVDLTHHNSQQAAYAPGQWITSESALEPGDIVYFGSSRSDVTHAGVYAGVSGGQQMIWDANTAFWVYPDGVHERTLASENSLGFVGAARVASGGGAAGGGSFGEGSFVQVSGHGEIFRIVGGAPLYVSSWSAFGGPQPTTTISQQQFDSLRPYPADGTTVNTTNDGRVYVFAGGAPLYVSSWAGIGGERPSISIDGWDVANPGNPAAHVREYPADGTLIVTPSDHKVYEVAGGAPLYVSSWAGIGGERPSTGVDTWDVDNAGNPYAHLRPYPADGTFLNTLPGRVYRVAGGAPFAVGSWSVFGGIQTYTTVDQWDLDNPANPAAHLLPTPLDGTVVEGLPSDEFWLFSGGDRSLSSDRTGAVQVDDFGLSAFPVRPASAAPPVATATKAAAVRADSSGGTQAARKDRLCKRPKGRRHHPCAAHKHKRGRHHHGARPT